MIDNYSINAQRRRVFEAFGVPRTMLEASRAAKVERANVCWYVHDMRESGEIYELGKSLCSISKTPARHYTTNPNGWQHFAITTRPIWEPLSDDLQLQAWQAIKSYYLAHYDCEKVAPAPEVAGIWNDSIKPMIDKEVML